MNNSTNYLDSRLDNLRLGTNVTRGQNAPIVHTTYHQPGVNQTISSSTPNGVLSTVFYSDFVTDTRRCYLWCLLRQFLHQPPHFPF